MDLFKVMGVTFRVNSGLEKNLISRQMLDVGRVRVRWCLPLRNPVSYTRDGALVKQPCLDGDFPCLEARLQPLESRGVDDRVWPVFFER